MSNTYLLAGASSKTAQATAELLKQDGHKVIGISTKPNTTSLYDAYHTIENYDKGLYPIISEPLSGLAYFPGTINLKPFHRLTAEEFLNDYHINALGAVRFIQTYLNGLKGGVNPSVVLMSTVAVSTGMPFHSSVAMAKGAIEGLTRALAAELAPSIRINCIAPSLTNTPLGEKFLNTPEKREASEKRNPLKKVGEPIDLANAAYFLLSEKASWVTGQILAVDGGMNHIKLL